MYYFQVLLLQLHTYTPRQVGDFLEAIIMQKFFCTLKSSILYHHSSENPPRRQVGQRYFVWASREGTSKKCLPRKKRWNQRSTEKYILRECLFTLMLRLLPSPPRQQVSENKKIKHKHILALPFHLQSTTPLRTDTHVFHVEKLLQNKRGTPNGAQPHYYSQRNEKKKQKLYSLSVATITNPPTHTPTRVQRLLSRTSTTSTIKSIVAEEKLRKIDTAIFHPKKKHKHRLGHHHNSVSIAHFPRQSLSCFCSAAQNKQ